jgi:hypothetical protein
MSSARGGANLWGCKSKSAINSNMLDPHIRYLIALLALPRADLSELLTKAKDHDASSLLLAPTGDRPIFYFEPTLGWTSIRQG